MMTHFEPQDTLTAGERQALQRLLQQTPTASCASPEELTDYVTGILSPHQQTQIREHLETCPLCAGAAIDLRRAYLPVIQLQQGWRGWRGPVLSALRLLDPQLERAWQEHCHRYTPARQRTERATRTLRWSQPTITFATGAAVMALLMLTLRPPQSVAVDDGPGQSQWTITRGIKNAPAQPDASNKPVTTDSGNPTEQVVEQVMHPTAEQLPFAIGILEPIVQRHPELAGPRVALHDLYERALRTERDPAQRRQWQTRLDRLNASDHTRASH
jgi:hypothetical protein